MLDILSSLGCPLIIFFFVGLYVTIPSPPSFLGLASVGSLERPSGQWARGTVDRIRGLSCLFSCVMPGRSLGYSQSSGIESSGFRRPRTAMVVVDLTTSIQMISTYVVILVYRSRPRALVSRHAMEIRKKGIVNIQPRTMEDNQNRIFGPTKTINTATSHNPKIHP